MIASAPILAVAVLSGAEEAPDFCNPTRAEAVLDGEVIPSARGALVFSEAWVVVVASKLGGNWGKLGVGFKGEVASSQSDFHAESSVEQYFLRHLESAGLLLATVS